MKQIIAMGGGGFSMEPENLALDNYVLEQARSGRPRVCFLATASGDSADYIERFYDSMRSLDCEPTHLSLFKPPTCNLEEFLLEQDVIYVGGGNTRNLLVLWREWRIDKALMQAWKAAKDRRGSSAAPGGIIASPLSAQRSRPSRFFCLHSPALRFRWRSFIRAVLRC